MSELPSPPDAGDTPSMEVLRAWFIGDVLHCSLDVDVFEDLAAWGELLADLARHVANAVGEKDGSDPVVTLKAIRDTFAQELAEPDALPGENEVTGA